MAWFWKPDWDNEERTDTWGCSGVPNTPLLFIAGERGKKLVSVGGLCREAISGCKQAAVLLFVHCVNITHRLEESFANSHGSEGLVFVQ